MSAGTRVLVDPIYLVFPHEPRTYRIRKVLGKEAYVTSDEEHEGYPLFCGWIPLAHLRRFK